MRHVAAVFEVRVSEALRELVDRWGGGVVGLAELTGGVGLFGLGVLDLGWGKSAAFGDVRAHVLGVALAALGGGGLGGGGGRLAAWAVGDVEFAAGGGL